MRPHPLPGWFGVLACLAATTLAATITAQTGPPPTGESWALFQGLARATRIEFSVPAGACEGAADRLRAALTERGVFEAPSEPSVGDPGAVRILVGAPDDPALESLARRVGVESLQPGFRVLGREYVLGGDALMAVFEDPTRPGRPLCLVLGNDLERVAAYLDGIPRLSRPHLWVHAEGELALECPLEPRGAPRADEARDYLAQRERYFAAGSRQEFDGLVVSVHGALSEERWLAYGVALGRARKRTLGWLGAEAVPRAEVFLYEHPEDFEACLGTSALAVANRLLPRAHVLLAPGLPDDGGATLARVVARAVAGTPASQWVEDGLAVAAAGSWWGRPLDEWVAHLAAGELLPGAGEIVIDSASDDFSEHLLAPARAMLFEQTALTPGHTRALWKSTTFDAKVLTPFYRLGIEKARTANRPARGKRGDPQASSTAAGGASFCHGIALVEGSNATYGTRSVERSLAELRALEPGPDAISLTVFASGIDPLAPLLAPRGRVCHASASDVALANAGSAAHAQGFAVLLSLEVLAHPHGAWADVLSWTGPEDSRLFFEHYERVALHQALLAELIGLEFFSFGSNLRESTRTEDQEGRRDAERIEVRRQGWFGLIRRLHAAYRGALIHAARFPMEMEEIGFFERLDGIGLLFWPGLVPDGVPSELDLRRSLRHQVQQALDFSVRWNRPLILAQVGFPARADSWAMPWVPRGAEDPAGQVRYFSALADVLAGPLENAPVLRGYFLWNWPLEGGSSGARGDFSLRAPALEPALRRLFKR